MARDKGILQYSPNLVMSMQICGITFEIDPTKSYVQEDRFSTKYFIRAAFSNISDAYDVLNKLVTYKYSDKCSDKYDDVKENFKVTNALDFIEL
jgi:hypothetical protein